MRARPFRFGVQVGGFEAESWIEEARSIEAMGFSTLFVPDHFNATLWDPTTLLAGVAAATERLNVGSLVYDVDYRHPVIYARQAATLHLLSRGRHEFGIGAGWMREDYTWAGLRYDRPSVRIARLDEALTIIRGMCEAEATTFEGEHYQVSAVPQAAPLPTGERPRILVGGGGPKLLGVAGRHADIVGITPMIPKGRITAETLADSTPDRMREKVRWLREAAAAAGRDPDDIELSVMAFGVAITDDPTSAREAIGRNVGLSADEVAQCPFFITGGASEIRDTLEQRREELDISYIVIQRDTGQMERFVEDVVGPLAGR